MAANKFKDWTETSLAAYSKKQTFKGTVSGSRNVYNTGNSSLEISANLVSDEAMKEVDAKNIVTHR